MLCSLIKIYKIYTLNYNLTVFIYLFLNYKKLVLNLILNQLLKIRSRVLITGLTSYRTRTEPGWTFSTLIIMDKEIPELDQCSEYNNEILTRPSKAITILSCGHTFHRICIEKKLLLTMSNTCPFSDCRKNVDIIEPFPTTNQESPILTLSNMMSERFILSSPIIQMEGIENTGF